MPASRRARSTPASPRTSCRASGRLTRRSTLSTSPASSPFAIREGKAVPDLLRPGLAVLFVGINPSLASAAAGRHFARPGNRFWPVLHLAGFTPRRLTPHEDEELLDHGVGATNLVDRPTRQAAELWTGELREGALALAATVAGHAPRLVAMVGLTAWRTALGRPGAVMGLQDEPIGDRPVWVLPNPSGLNAHYGLPDLVRLYTEARAFAESLDLLEHRAPGPPGHDAPRGGR